MIDVRQRSLELTIIRPTAKVRTYLTLRDMVASRYCLRPPAPRWHSDPSNLTLRVFLQNGLRIHIDKFIGRDIFDNHGRVGVHDYLSKRIVATN